MTKPKMCGRWLAAAGTVVLVLASNSAGQRDVPLSRLEVAPSRLVQPKFVQPRLVEPTEPSVGLASASLSQPSLALMTRQAGYIFVGKVLAVRHAAATNPDEVATMRVTFHVEQALRGARAGTDLTVAEWAGLWNGGERYRVGDRMLLFLYPNSKLGLTSPVAGRQGRFEIDRSNGVEINAERRVLLESARSPAVWARVLPGNKIPLRQLTNAIRRAARQEER